MRRSLTYRLIWHPVTGVLAILTLSLAVIGAAP